MENESARKAKNCPWKMLWDAIPTIGKVAEILGPHGREDVSCIFYGLGVETLIHLLLDCFISRIIWSQSPWALDIRAEKDQPLISWFKKIIDPSQLGFLPVDDYHFFQFYALVAWDLLWWTRNQIVHKAAFLDVVHLVKRINKVSSEQ